MGGNAGMLASLGLPVVELDEVASFCHWSVSRALAYNMCVQHPYMGPAAEGCITGSSFHAAHDLQGCTACASADGR